jgi:predicted peptidase
MTNVQKPGAQVGYPPISGGRLPYLLFLPQEYGLDPARKWPLLLFLHGAGERGDDLDVLRDYGPVKEAENKPDFPFICLAPQCPDSEIWLGMLPDVKLLLDEIAAAYLVDEDRLCLTGMSLGGYGAWALATLYSDLFAALAPVCGGGIVLQAEKLKDIPIWAFHGEEDEVVPVRESERMVEAVNAAGGKAKLTTYPGVMHDSWTITYENPELYEWLLDQSR